MRCRPRSRYTFKHGFRENAADEWNQNMNGPPPTRETNVPRFDGSISLALPLHRVVLYMRVLYLHYAPLRNALSNGYVIEQKTPRTRYTCIIRSSALCVCIIIVLWEMMEHNIIIIAVVKREKFIKLTISGTRWWNSADYMKQPYYTVLPTARSVLQINYIA